MIMLQMEKHKYSDPKFTEFIIDLIEILSLHYKRTDPPRETDATLNFESSLSRKGINSPLSLISEYLTSFSNSPPREALLKNESLVKIKTKDSIINPERMKPVLQSWIKEEALDDEDEQEDESTNQSEVMRMTAKNKWDTQKITPAVQRRLNL